MQRKKHKRKMNHVVIVTSDTVDANVKQFRMKPWVLQTVILLLCVVIGIVIGCFVYEEQVWETVNRKNEVKQEEIVKLESEKANLEQEKHALESQMAELNEQIQILSATVNEKVQSENALTEQLEKMSMPTEFPLTGSASMEENAEGNPICIFNASVGTTVVATASGTVTAINDDDEYGHNIWIDHGNGYVTVYRNSGEPTVKKGDSVVQGTTLFIIADENGKLGYQMLKDGEYIHPMDMLSISG